MTNDQDRGQIARRDRDRIFRYLGLAVGAFLGWQFGVFLAGSDNADEWGPLALLMGATFGGIFFILSPYLVSGGIRRIRRQFAAMDAIDIVAGGVGLIAGGVLSALLAFPASLLPNPFGQLIPFFVAVVVCAISVFVVVLRKNDLAALVFQGQPASEPSSKLLLDTSVIIDGRIVDLMRTGVISMPLAIPRFILRELQGIADSGDVSRKARGRRGLDALEQLQHEVMARVEIIEIDVAEESAVDDKLIRLALLSNYAIFTGDQNLERVAKLQGAEVININTLAQALRPPVVAGEEMEIEIVQPGRESGQGIGFLDDGTLIVVEDGVSLVGSDVRVVITRTLQTGTGRMAFATLKEEVVA